jgi:6-phosphofructokinase
MSFNVGSENRVILPNSQAGKVIAVFTSGGDAQGMNSAVRAVVRSVVSKVFLIDIFLLYFYNVLCHLIQDLLIDLFFVAFSHFL